MTEEMRQQQMAFNLGEAAKAVRRYAALLNDKAETCGDCHRETYESFGEHLRAVQARAIVERLDKWLNNPTGATAGRKGETRAAQQ